MGFKLYAAHLSGVSYDNEGNFGQGLLIINEAEVFHMRQPMADNLIRIPMYGKVESLNAAVAAAILMYEAARQEGLFKMNTEYNI